MAMGEDFGDFGDEQFLGFCAEDWRDYAPLDAEENLHRAQERRSQQEREELALEFVDEQGDPDYPEQVGQDISEFDEESEEYYDCDFRE